MVKIAPSLLSADFSKLGDEVRRIGESGADWIHVDVMDGHFVQNISFGFPVIDSIRGKTDLPFDVHLMIADPKRYVDRFVDSGADMLTVHVEATKGETEDVLRMIMDRGVKAGLTMNPDTPIEMMMPYLHMVDLVLVMTVFPGFGGQRFIESGLEKIGCFKEYSEMHDPNLEISVDGGINMETGKRCVDAGATVLAAGSSLFGSKDMRAEISAWRSHFNQ